MPTQSATPHLEQPYDVHPSLSYANAILNNLPNTTGKSLPDWLRVLEQAHIVGEAAQCAWLKTEHQLGGTTAGMIAEMAVDKGQEYADPNVYLQEAVKYVEAMYAGAKAGLRPMHNTLLQLARSLGADVKVCPCKTIVPLYRQHVFAQLKPSTKTRLDLGLALKGVKHALSPRLIDTGGLAKGDRITHRFALTAPAEIDAEVKEWLRIAYGLDSEHQPDA